MKYLIFILALLTACNSTDPTPNTSWSFSVASTASTPAFSGNFQLKETASKTYTIVGGGTFVISGTNYLVEEVALPQLIAPNYNTTVELRTAVAGGDVDAVIRFTGSFTDTEIKASGASYKLRLDSPKDLPNFTIKKD